MIDDNYDHNDDHDQPSGKRTKRTKKPDPFPTPKAFADYLRRIGAEEVNFTRAMIRIYGTGKHNSYYVEKVLITLDRDDYSIKLSREGKPLAGEELKQYEPTPDEAEAIKSAYIAKPPPRSICASESCAQHYIRALIRERGLNEKDFYIIRTRRPDNECTVKLIQERWTDELGDKGYSTHTLWSDRNWRKQEPDGALPFWKPEERSYKPIMIHEGAKAAKCIDWMLNDRSAEAHAARAAHPWADELESYEHWGMIGGALAPHRSDYSELVREQPIRVVYFCDNDKPGKEVLQKISKLYGGKLRGVMLDGRWPESWDLADPMPKTMFRTTNGKMRFVGPTLKSLYRAATWATEKVPTKGKGAPAYKLTKAFREEWLHTEVAEVFVHCDWPYNLKTADEFNSKVGPYSDVDDVARLLRKHDASKMEKVHYAPDAKSGASGNVERGQFINTYHGSDIEPEKANQEPWENFLKMLIPDEGDRHEVKRWCATLIAKPQTKMTYGMLLNSEQQGVGKTTLGEKVLAPLLGNHNVSFPGESDIVDSPFNSWIAHKRLAVVNEIYAGASSKAYNKLKSVASDRYLTVNKKNQPTYDLENWIHIFACSNSPRALKLSMDDRRWFVPKVTEEKLSVADGRKYWVEFNIWLKYEGGLGIIMQWAIDFVLAKGNAVEAGDEAPDSSAKMEMIEAAIRRGWCSLQTCWTASRNWRSARR